MKFLLVQEISSRNLCLSTWKTICCDIKFPTFARNFLPVTRIVFLWQEFFSCDKNFFLVTRIFFLWQAIFCDKKFLPFTKNPLLWSEISFCDKKFLTVAKHFLLRKIYVYLLFVNFCQHFVWAWRFRGSLAPWLPGNIPPCLIYIM